MAAPRGGIRKSEFAPDGILPPGSSHIAKHSDDFVGIGQAEARKAQRERPHLPPGAEERQCLHRDGVNHSVLPGSG